jgi:hypothetical protein
MCVKNSSRTPGRQPGRHGKYHAANIERLRQHIAGEAARVMAEEGLRDYHLAKRKALERLGLPDAKHLPSNQEIEVALKQYLRLFHAERHSRNLYTLRRLALEAMRFLEIFQPRLVGAALNGTVTAASGIELHVTADTPEEFALWLREHAVPFEQSERRLRFGGDRYASLPSYRFLADKTPIEVCVFNRRGARETPLSPVDGKPMKRASIKDVETLAREESAGFDGVRGAP